MFSEKVQIKIKKEFGRLHDVTFLDHAGATMYADTQMKSVLNDLCTNVYGNPHSLNLSSRYSSDVIDQIRYRILQHFNGDPTEYTVIFTSSATSSLKLVAESFNWCGQSKIQPEFQNYKKISVITGKENSKNEVIKGEPNDELVYNGNQGIFAYLQDNHTSVLGMREYALQNNAAVKVITHNEAFNIFNELPKPPERNVNIPLNGNSLFVYPAQCNFSGVKYPLSWIEKVQKGALNRSCFSENEISRWFCYLDAAAYVATNALDLSVLKPDFVCISFYKLFGYPTGIGALLVRNDSAECLKRTYFGGGTVLISLSTEMFHVPRPNLSDRYEDGTIPFLSIVALRHGFDILKLLTGDMGKVSNHTFSLAQYVFKFLIQLHHSNGSPAAIVYSDTPYESVLHQGGIVNFNLLRPNGETIGYVEVLNLTNLHGIHVRTGCFCNPGACQRHLALSLDDLKAHFKAGHVCGDDRDLVNGQPTGSIRISFGYMSTKEDADKLLNLISSTFVQQPAIFKFPVWWSDFISKYEAKFCNANSKICDDLHCNTPTSHSTSADKISNQIIDNQYKMSDNQPCDKFTTFLNNVSNKLTTKLKMSTDSHLDLHTLENSIRDVIAISHIFLYPVKSCAALPVQSWKIGNKGLLYDREWMIVTPAGVCLSQKQEPKLCLIKPSIDLQAQILQLDFPGRQLIKLPLNGTSVTRNVTLCQTKVCGDHIQVQDCGDEVAQWLSDALYRDGLRLIRQLDTHLRLSKQQAGSEESALSLANQAQFLLLNSASINWLGDILEKEVNFPRDGLLDRFRANFVISGNHELEENTWTKIQVGKIPFQVDGPCTRCQMICIDQATGDKTAEPLRTISSIFKGKIRFGIYLSHHVDKTKVENISVGDKVHVICND